MKVRFLQPILLDVRSIQGRNLMERDGMLDVVAVIRQANAQLTTVRFRGLPGPPGRAGPRIKSQLLHASCTFFCTDLMLSSGHPAARSTRSECWRSSSRSDVDAIADSVEVLPRQPIPVFSRVLLGDRLGEEHLENIEDRQLHVL